MPAEKGSLLILEKHAFGERCPKESRKLKTQIAPDGRGRKKKLSLVVVAAEACRG